MNLHLNNTFLNQLLLVFFMLLLLFSCRQNVTKTTTDTPELKSVIGYTPSASSFNIAFGSCNKHNEPQPLWNPILSNKPDLWIWTGDIIYGDTKNMKLMASKYEAQKQISDYQLLRNYCPVIGVWDDHDYGQNDGGKNYPKKAESKNLLMSFLDVPENAAVRKHEGVYTSYSYGEKDKIIKVILLDCRTFKDDIKKSFRSSVPNPNADLLGATQWTWVENELKNTNAAVNIIISSIQVIPEEHRFEKWANHPTDRTRLFNLLKDTQPKNTIILSGDRHIGEISKIDIDGFGPLVEVTSSGLTHAYTRFTSEDNKHRIGKASPVLNFGVINVDWEVSLPTLSIELRGENNKLLNSYHQQLK